MFGWFSSPSARISLYNTASRSVEAFEPLKAGEVKIYSCGPTVYNYAHIGNMRAALLSDILRRTFEYAGYSVTQVMNITDFGHLVADADAGDDKMTVGLKREGMALTMQNMFVLATRYALAYKEDQRAMHMLPPHHMPRASEHVPGMIAYVETLLKKGYAYKTSDGVYFDVQKFPAYGSLGGSASSQHSRIGISDEKRDPRDFTLWKFDSALGWDAPWGKGFPGWHIECTAMSTEYLGKSFDIHTGGVDHIPVHHNNEIAQAEAANSRPYAKYWLHNEFITIDNARVAKSLGNEVLLRQLKSRGVHPVAYRYWLLTGHYRQSINFTWEAVQGAQQALYRAQRAFTDLRGSGVVDRSYKQRFEAALYTDLDTPRAIALMWELIKDSNVAGADKRATLADFDRVLGFGFVEKAEGLKSEAQSVPDEVQGLVDAREEARKAKEYQKADELRTSIHEAGYDVEDGAEGPTITKRVDGVVP
jgi:cysteinyl-tRNA synthetase